MSQSRVQTAWSVTSSAGIAVVTVVWGLLAQLTGPRAAIALAGVLLLATPFLLPRQGATPEPAIPAIRRRPVPESGRGR